MDYRDESFRRKFSSAAQILDVSPGQIVSLKFRDNVGSYEDYRLLVERLEQDIGIQCSTVTGDLQGRGYMLGLDKTKLIVVEHETGLEILYIAGSIASLVGLVPIVLQTWRALRRKFWRRESATDHPVEIRRMDQAGHLHEEYSHDRQFAGSLMAISTTAITGGLVENEMRNLIQELEKINSRVDALEKQICHKGTRGDRRGDPKPSKSPSRPRRTRKPKRD